MKKVAILGGGVAGMSAAHELIERGYQVEVYEKMEHYVGGKARSIDVPDSGSDGRKPLPGEHGFRFFPGFYQHITDLMKRTPIDGGKKSVYDNLVKTERVMMATEGKKPIINIVNFPKSKEDLKVMFKALTDNDTGLTESDVDVFSHKIWQLMTSSYERRQEVYERISWWQYMQADQQCKGQPEDKCPYQVYFVGGLTHSLVAAQPKLMSTKTGGDILLQLIFLMLNPTKNSDRVLNAPTNEAWLNPWYDYLKAQGVKYHHNHEVQGFNVDAQTGTIASVEVADKATGKNRTITADYYISALPVERMAPLVSEEMANLDHTLGYLKPLSESTNWMNGIQFYLKEDVPLTEGHCMFLDSPWAITAISQIQFWEKAGYKIEEHGNGEVKGVLSIDVSNWHNPGHNGKEARHCNYEEIIDEVWLQLEKSLNVDGEKVLDKSMIAYHSFLDPDIIIKRHGGKLDDDDAEKLLVNQVNTWSLRPEAYTQIDNLFLASDYVRTNTDLATMEAAAEAAKRAVNSIISASGSKRRLCKIHKMHEPWVLWPLRYLDKCRHRNGEPWKDEAPWIFKLGHYFLNFFHRFVK